MASPAQMTRVRTPALRASCSICMTECMTVSLQIFSPLIYWRLRSSNIKISSPTANPVDAHLWRMLTQRLTNSCEYNKTRDPRFGQYHAERHEKTLAGFAGTLLSSEPFCWLLRDVTSPSKDPLVCRKSETETEFNERRRTDLIAVFRTAVNCLILCETATNGRPVFQGIAELGGVFRDSADVMDLHVNAWRKDRALYEGREILVVAQPGLAYVDGFIDGLTRTTEIMSAAVLRTYERGDEEEDEYEDGAENVDDGKDKGWSEQTAV
ncbi:hypothetical protein BJX70DRAFT_85580 [Aspergillus crustosus]